MLQQVLDRAFANPQEYRDLILNHVKVPVDKQRYSGKAFICVSFTRFCPVGCNFCFFSSKQANRKKTILDAFDENGIQKFIDFANEADLGYLLVSGGGEPFIEKESLLKVVEQVRSDKIVLVTSGNWAKTKTGASNYIMKIYDAFKRRSHNTDLVIRVSVDEEHARNGLGLDPAYNLIEIFEQSFLAEKNFTLQFHTLFDDTCIEEFLDKVKTKIVAIEEHTLRSDARTVVKISPAEKTIVFNSGLRLKIGYAKVFYSNIKVNLNAPGIIERNLKVFQQDLNESEGNNPSILTNTNGDLGLDFWVNFNGNVTTWGNQVPDNIYNLYEDDYNTVADNTFADPISLAYLEKGDNYRSGIVYEVNPRAVVRSKATNIRDYAGALVCEEELTRLYLSVRVLQDYIKEGRISEQNIKSWPIELQQLISCNQGALKDAYKNSKYSIVDQYINKDSFDINGWQDFLDLINLGHYELTDEQRDNAFKYFNDKVSANALIPSEVTKEKAVGHFPEERIIAIKKSILRKIMHVQQENILEKEIA